MTMTMTCHDQCSDRHRSRDAAETTTCPTGAGRHRIRRRPRIAVVWTATSAVAAALLTLQLTAVGPAVAAAAAAATASTAGGGRNGDATVAALEPAVAESKKLTSGKAAAMDGYVLTGSHKGDKGYNEDDVFGDKDADSYGFGTQVSYGSRAGDGGNGAYHHSTAYDDNGRSNPKYSAWHFEDKDGRPTKRYVYDSHKKKKDPLAVEAEASEYDSVEAYDDGDDGTHAGYEADDAEPEYGSLYDSGDVYNDADTYY